MGFERREEGGGQSNSVCVNVAKNYSINEREPPLGLAGFNYRLWKSVQVCVVERDGGINRLSNWS